ncbi:MAG: VanW family protein [Acetivibrionales bacterium]|jgi:vancomycin resistance protein YoaR
METEQLANTLPPDTDEKIQSGKKLPILFISVFSVLVIILVILGLLLNSSKIYHGVLIGNKDVGGHTKESLFAYLQNLFEKNFHHTFITFSGSQFERTVSISEMGIKLDIGAMTEKAYGIGREGNIAARLAKIAKLQMNPVSVELILDLESENFNDLLEDIRENTYREIIPSNIVIMDDQVILCTGLPGQEIDEEHLKNEIINAIKQLESSTIKLHVIEKSPPPLDVETTLATLNRPPVNAEFERTSRTTYNIKPHQMGLALDRTKLMEILSYVENRDKNEYEEIILPVEFIVPEITEGTLKSRLFRDTLASYTTYFNTNSKNNYNRSINIGIAAESINGTLLLPGEEFSFNKVVGPRTAQKGYKTAHVFVAGQIQDGTGGGVCQVSTTLYNAVLRANLEIKERHNHMFTVGYVPLGHDAAVSYGYADLVFANTTDYPLQICAEVSPGNSITFKIKSTNDYPSLSVKLATKTISTTPIKTVYIDDPTLPQGTETVVEKGMEGYVVDTYIRVYNGDTLIREEKLHRSVYQMYPRKIIRGNSPAAEIIE